MTVVEEIFIYMPCKIFIPHETSFSLRTMNVTFPVDVYIVIKIKIPTITHSKLLVDLSIEGVLLLLPETLVNQSSTTSKTQ